MGQSQFIQYINTSLKAILLAVFTTINGTKDEPSEYLHKRMLKKKFSVSGKWESVMGTYTRIRADIVAMNTTLPLKKRDALSQASGDIPKSGMELFLNENQLTEIMTMSALNTDDDTIAAEIFKDAKKCLIGEYELVESMFLEGLSTGQCVIDDTENVGTGTRVDYGIPVENKFGAGGAAWSNTSAKPLDDFDRITAFSKTKGDVISLVLMDSTAFNNMVKTTQFKEEYNFNIGYTGSILRTPSLSKANEILLDKYGFTIRLIDRSTVFERNGQRTTYKPWADGAVSCLTSEEVGSLVYAKLAEMGSPVAGVSYETIDDFVLMSMWRSNRPLSEYTSSQARVLPVISAPVYLLDTKTVQA